MTQETKNINNPTWKNILLFYFLLQIILPGIILLLLYLLIKGHVLGPNILTITILVIGSLIIPIGIINTLKKLLVKWRNRSDIFKKATIKSTPNRPFLITDILNTTEDNKVNYNQKDLHLFKQIGQFIKISLAIIIIFSSIFYFTSPDAIVVNENGKVLKMTNKFRAICQGKKFWNHQYKLAIDRHSKLLKTDGSFYQDMMNIDNTFKNIEKSQNELLSAYYSKEEKLAQSLRRQADSIEKDYTYRKIEQSLEGNRISEIKKLGAIISKIESRLLTEKQTFTPKLLIYCSSLFILIIFFSSFKINVMRRLK
jgi:hypothetical protein